MHAVEIHDEASEVDTARRRDRHGIADVSKRDAEVVELATDRMTAVGARLGGVLFRHRAITGMSESEFSIIISLLRKAIDDVQEDVRERKRLDEKRAELERQLIESRDDRDRQIDERLEELADQLEDTGRRTNRRPRRVGEALREGRRTTREPIDTSRRRHVRDSGGAAAGAHPRAERHHRDRRDDSPRMACEGLRVRELQLAAASPTGPTRPPPGGFFVPTPWDRCPPPDSRPSFRGPWASTRTRGVRGANLARSPASVTRAKPGPLSGKFRALPAATL